MTTGSMSEFSDGLMEERRKYPHVADFTRSDSATQRASKMVQIIEADWQGFRSLVHLLDDDGYDVDEYTIKPSVRWLIEAQESILDMPYSEKRSNILRKECKDYDTATIVAIQLARQMLNSDKVYND